MADTRTALAMMDALLRQCRQDAERLLQEARMYEICAEEYAIQMRLAGSYTNEEAAMVGNIQVHAEDLRQEAHTVIGRSQDIGKMRSAVESATGLLPSTPRMVRVQPVDPERRS